MVKVINISNKTVEVANIEIKPHSVYIFSDMSTLDRQKVAAMNAVGLVRAYEGNYDNEHENKKLDENIDRTTNITTEKPKSTRRSNRKK